LKKTGDKYVGTTRSGGPCSYVGFTPFVGMNEKGNNCSFQFAIEITALNPTRIEGQVMAYPPNTKFDCGKCSYKGQQSWRPFTWIPE
jgi:hypothetical protein